MAILRHSGSVPVATTAVEIVFCNGRLRFVAGDVDGGALARLILVVGCQSARNPDPLSAPRFDPLCGVEIRA